MINQLLKMNYGHKSTGDPELLAFGVDKETDNITDKVICLRS